MHYFNYTHFCQFLTVLKYSPIGVKFLPTIALHIMYTVKKKLENFQHFFVLKVLKYLGNSYAKSFFILF
jgi:hypothetical protein